MDILLFLLLGIGVGTFGTLVGIGGGLELLHQDAAHNIISSFLGHLAAGDLLVQRGGQLVLMTLIHIHTYIPSSILHHINH